MFCLVTVSIGRLNDHESVRKGVMVRLGELQTIHCDILNCGFDCGAIMVALLFTVPCALLEGLATVVFANTLVGHRHNKITAQRWFLRW